MTEQKIGIAVYASAHPGWGGSFQYAASILSALARLDSNTYQIKVWYHDDAWDPHLKALNFDCVQVPLRQQDRWYGLGVRVLQKLGIRQLWPNMARQWERLHRVTRQINAWNPKICINVQQTSLNLLPTIDQIAPIHDLMHLYEPQFEEVGNRQEWQDRQWLFTNIALRCRVILTDGRVGRSHVIETYPFAKEHVAILPFIAPRALTEATPIRPAKLDPGLGKDSFVFYPAHFWSHKNHVGLLEAIASLTNHPDIHCVFTGTVNKNGYPLVHQTIERLELGARVHNLGYVSDAELSWLYHNARLMVMPTFLGPTNIPPLEAMSLGCPVAISGIYGMPDQLGDAALYFDPKDIHSIARSLERLWTSPEDCKNLRNKGFTLIQNWGPEQFEGELLKIMSFIH